MAAYSCWSNMMRKDIFPMKQIALLLFAVAALCFLPAGPAPAAEHTILVVPKGMRAEFWKRIRKGALQAGMDRGVEVLFRGPHGSDNHGGQLQIILQTGIDEGVDAIVLAPNHGSKAAEVLGQAAAKGIKIVLIDSDMEFENRVSFVGSDNDRAGRDAAKFLLSQVAPGSTVLLLRYLRDNPSTDKREKGFVEMAGKTRPPCRVVIGDYGGVSVGEAYKNTWAAFMNNPEISAIFSPGEATTLGALRAVDDLKRDSLLRHPVAMVGFDDADGIRRALKDGTLQGAMFQNPFQIGYLGVSAACDAIEGKPVETRIVTETRLVTGASELPGE